MASVNSTGRYIHELIPSRAHPVQNEDILISWGKSRNHLVQRRQMTLPL